MTFMGRFSAGAVAVVVLLGAILALSSSGRVLAQTGAESSPLPQDQVATACATAEEAFATGEVMAGSKTLLDALRALDPDRADLVDLTTKPLHLLLFSMCTLMDDPELADFLAHSLDPETNPIDDAVLLYFYVEYKTHAEGREVKVLPLAETVQRAQRMEQSPHGLVRALGLLALSWYAPGNVVGESTRNAFNRLAELCPQAKSCREVLHRLLLVSAMPDPSRSQAVQELLNRNDWNPAIQALIADDPVVGLVREMSAHSSRAADESAEADATATDRGDAVTSPEDRGSEAVLEAVQNHTEPEVRSWCLRLVHANGASVDERASVLPEAVRTGCETLAKSKTASQKSASEAGDGAVPLEVLRARHILLRQALKAGNLAAAGEHCDALFDSRCTEEPVDSNTYVNALVDAMNYGMALVKAGDRAKAITLFERVARKYPDSSIGIHCQQHVEHLTKVMALLKP